MKMQWMFILGALFLSLNLWGQSTQATRTRPSQPRSKHNCGHSTLDGVSFGWCIDEGDRERNTDLLYAFQGSDRDENDWWNNPENQDIRNEWQRMNVPQPTVISISFGSEWFLTEVDLPGKPALYPLVVHKIMPFLEAKLGSWKGRRLLKGVSMGGYNGVELLLKNGELFDRVALVCPVIQTYGPYSSRSEIEKFIQDRKDFINPDWVEGLVSELKEDFPTQALYDQHDPLVLIKKGPLKPAQVYLSCADHDEYGFFDGTKAFAEMALQNGSHVIWDPTHGGHCVVDRVKLAHFFAPLTH